MTWNEKQVFNEGAMKSNVTDALGTLNVQQTYLGSPIFKSYGLSTLPEKDSGTNADSDSKPDGYIVLCRTCSHCTDLDSDPYLDLNPISL